LYVDRLDAVWIPICFLLEVSEVEARPACRARLPQVMELCLPPLNAEMEPIVRDGLVMPSVRLRMPDFLSTQHRMGTVMQCQMTNSLWQVVQCV